MKQLPNRAKVLFVAAVLAVGALGINILRNHDEYKVGDEVVPRSQNGIMLTDPFGIPGPGSSAFMDQCMLKEKAIVEETSFTRGEGKVLKVHGKISNCAGWTAAFEVEPLTLPPTLTPQSRK